MNTLIEYMYRDASNYKEWASVIVEGVITRAEIDDCYDHQADGFIPSQVGLENLQTRMINFPTDDDHVWHEIISVQKTTDDPTIELTAEQLLANFHLAKGRTTVYLLNL